MDGVSEQYGVSNAVLGVGIRMRSLQRFISISIIFVVVVVINYISKNSDELQFINLAI